MLVPAPDLLPRTLQEFSRRHGRAPTWAARAPGRVNLIGEHTDYLGGLSLPIALPFATWIAAAGRDDSSIRLSSGAELTWTGDASSLAPESERVQGWAAYVVGALRAVGWQGGLDLHVESSVPIGSGLSSSAALVCAVATALSTVAPPDLLEPCIRAEQNYVGVPTGGMDQTISLLARPDHAALLDFADGSLPSVTQVAWDPEVDDVELLVVDTGVSHANDDGAFAARRAEAEAAMALSVEQVASADDPLPRRRRHVVSENDRVLRVVAALGQHDWSEVGALFSASHASLRDDHEVSSVELDTTVAAAVSAGALGARMTGGGFGGCVVVLSPVEARDDVVRAVRAAAAATGQPVPSFLRGDASGPATRLRVTGP